MFHFVHDKRCGDVLLRGITDDAYMIIIYTLTVLVCLLITYLVHIVNKGFLDILVTLLKYRFYINHLIFLLN